MTNFICTGVLVSVFLMGCSSPKKELSSTNNPQTEQDKYEEALDFFSNQKNWGLNRSIGVNAYAAWSITKGRESVVVAVVDTGIDINHPDLKDNLYHNPGEIGVVSEEICKRDDLVKNKTPEEKKELVEGCLKMVQKCQEETFPLEKKDCNKATNKIDDDENGLVDDLIGWDFVEKKSLAVDAHGHGTHVSGIVASKFNKKLNTSGVAPNVKILPYRYYYEAKEGVPLFKDESKNWSTNNIENSTKALWQAAKSGARIINYSGGGNDFSQEEYNAIKFARDRGVLVIAAAGNGSFDPKTQSTVADNLDEKVKYYPCAYDLDNIICVGATTMYRMKNNSSNYGKKYVHVFAPGDNIRSTLPKDNYGYLTGTSQATAFVSGVAALIWSKKPSLLMTEVRNLILNTVQKSDHLKDYALTGGIVDAYKALKEIDTAEKYLKYNPAVMVASKNGDAKRVISEIHGGVKFVGTKNELNKIQIERAKILKELELLEE